MISQTARATTARESQYRIDRPNSVGRASKVLALDEPAVDILRELAGYDWQGAEFVAVGQDDCRRITAETEQHSSLTEALNGADVVVMVVTSATNPDQVDRVGRYCSDNRVMTTGFVLDEPGNPALKPILIAVRSCVVSLVLETDRDSLIECLRALRA